MSACMCACMCTCASCPQEDVRFPAVSFSASFPFETGISLTHLSLSSAVLAYRHVHPCPALCLLTGIWTKLSCLYSVCSYPPSHLLSLRSLFFQSVLITAIKVFMVEKKFKLLVNLLIFVFFPTPVFRRKCIFWRSFVCITLRIE